MILFLDDVCFGGMLGVCIKCVVVICVFLVISEWWCGVFCNLVSGCFFYKIGNVVYGSVR